ncbi:phosphoribosylformylglycinamidine cyclo-ligase, partial [PVC group bacterium]|nr:phosphoribosylformylglycinamidine cyclo-ligase [PVC group bacterium]
MNDKQFNYKSSGVDIDAGNEAVKKIAALAKGTFGPKVLTNIGGFSGLFSFDKNAYQDPVLVSSTDGVGTKLLIAQKMDCHNSIGIDLVAMCVNDLICTGAEPLFFLDYIACGKLSVCRIEEIVKGMADGCRDSGCSLMGGETAEMPGMYKEDEYDLAGFAVGVVDRAKIITGETIKEGDILIGLSSSGLHSNGYSLVRKVLLEKAGLDVTSTCQGIDGCLGDELLRPTRIYVKVIKKIKDKFPLFGIAH